ncbi:hypothetical protein BDQ17DRAFT_1366675 [Cyathus striatus]|nr:hypothetical protein BDQ17DRAFT_1366675 [Cyathus striatus]
MSRSLSWLSSSKLKHSRIWVYLVCALVLGLIDYSSTMGMRVLIFSLTLSHMPHTHSWTLLPTSHSILCACTMFLLDSFSQLHCVTLILLVLSCVHALTLFLLPPLLCVCSPAPCFCHTLPCAHSRALPCSYDLSLSPLLSLAHSPMSSHSLSYNLLLIIALLHLSVTSLCCFPEEVCKICLCIIDYSKC